MKDKTMPDLQYNFPTVNMRWSTSRETDHAVAVAIHAISDDTRLPGAIWDDPTPAEWDHVKMAIQNYQDNGLVDLGSTFRWGEETLDISE